MKRGGRIRSIVEVVGLVENGASLFHERVVVSAGQLKTKSVGWYLEKILEGKLYQVAAPVVSAAARRWQFYEDALRSGLPIDGLERFIIFQTTGRRPARPCFPFTVVWDRDCSADEIRFQDNKGSILGRIINIEGGHV